MANFRLKENADLTSIDPTPSGAAVLPIAGFIMPFAGTTAPSGWAICDGTNGTPDLRGYFAIGASAAGNVGAAGGVAGDTHTHSYAFSALSVQNASNTHATPTANLAAGGGTSHGHSFTIAVNTPSHYSGNYINWSNGNNTTRTFRSHDHVGTTPAFGTNASSSTHSHSVAAGSISTTISETAHTHTVAASPSGTTTTGAITPANIIMNYIMKL